MIGVNGQYVFIFSIADKKDFIEETEFVQFTIIEEAGNILPTFQLGFYLLDDSLFPLFHEGNQLKVSFGRTRETAIDCPLEILHIHSGRSSSNKRLINATGMIAANAYRSNTNTFLSTKKSGVEVLKDIAQKNGFKWVSNITKSDDSQVWVNPNWNDRKFVNEVWMHSYLNKSFPAVGITSTNQFIVKDVLKDNTPVFNFTKNVKDESKDISYDEDFNIETSTGLVNSFAGYGKKVLTYNIEDGTEELISETPSQIIALTKKLAKNADIEAKFSSSGIQSDNVHTNYHRAYLKNFTKLTSLGTIKVTVSFQNDFRPIKVLDRVTFKDDDVSTLRQASAEFNSGEYIVSKVSRTVANRQFNTTCVLCRESFNQIKIS